ncbi:MAG TPA: CAAX prenyl protease-related protein [Candidatus Kapabacteria bacterium]|nr:CAAX prenyl protease-related protein [Candidatus Kapabacteria bacterium]
MTALIAKLRSTPFIARVAPYITFVALTALQGQFGDASKYWFYFAKTFVGIWLIWAMWPAVKEMRFTFSLEAVLVGVVVFVVWIALDPFYPKLVMGDGKAWNPHQQFGAGSALAWLFIATRILGSTLVVPPIEEAFFRSFLYRYVIKEKFDEVPLKQFHFVALTISSLLFAFIHREWLAGIFCGVAYQWLVIRKGHLGDAMTAHAITNLLLGLWVVYKGAWQFW